MWEREGEERQCPWVWQGRVLRTQWGSPNRKLPREPAESAPRRKSLPDIGVHPLMPLLRRAPVSPIRPQLRAVLKYAGIYNSISIYQLYSQYEACQNATTAIRMYFTNSANGSSVFQSRPSPTNSKGDGETLPAHYDSLALKPLTAISIWRVRLSGFRCGFDPLSFGRKQKYLVFIPR